MNFLSPEFERDFSELRRKVNECIEWYWEQGEPGKSYEGRWELSFDFPGAVDGDEAHKLPPDYCVIRLHCYLIGPHRHYEWRGKTPEAALAQCRKCVEQWIKQEYTGEE